MPVRHYWKSIIAAVGAAVIALQAAITDEDVTPNEWTKIGIAAVTALLVYAKSNEPPA